MTTTAIGSTDPTTILFIEEIPLASSDRVLILHADDPALSIAIARQAAEVVVYDASYSALSRLRDHLAARKIGNVIVSDDVFPDGAPKFDAAILPIAKGRDYARGLLWSARRMLKPGGRLYVGGPTDGGAKTLINDAGELFGAAGTLAYKRRCRVGVAEQPDSPGVFPAAWGIDPTAMQTRSIADLTLHTMPGVFSWDHLDKGTEHLLAALDVRAGDRVLDMGCGYGVIGLTAAKRGAAHVTLTDDNLLAVRCARANVATNEITNAEVVVGDVYSALDHQKFDLIVSNPPFHQKFDVNTNVAHRLIREAKPLLRSGGRLVIVSNAFLRYEKVMAEHFRAVRPLTQDSRFAVFEAQA